MEMTMAEDDDDLTLVYMWARRDADDEIKKLRAENERLREALRYYAKNHYPNVDDGPWGPNSNDFGDVARAALGEDK
jgi:hypothetical protein